jgi:hypothetical protein
VYVRGIGLAAKFFRLPSVRRSQVHEVGTVFTHPIVLSPESRFLPARGYKSCSDNFPAAADIDIHPPPSSFPAMERSSPPPRDNRHKVADPEHDMVGSFDMEG